MCNRHSCVGRPFAGGGWCLPTLPWNFSLLAWILPCKMTFLTPKSITYFVGGRLPPILCHTAMVTVHNVTTFDYQIFCLGISGKISYKSNQFVGSTCFEIEQSTIDVLRIYCHTHIQKCLKQILGNLWFLKLKSVSRIKWRKIWHFTSMKLIVFTMSWIKSFLTSRIAFL